MSEAGQGKKSILKPMLIWVGVWLGLGAIGSIIMVKTGHKAYLPTFWQPVDVLILLTILYFVAKEPLLQYLSERRQNIARDIETFKQQLAKAEKALEETRYRLAWIEDEVENIEARARSELALEKMRLEEEAKKQIERVKNEAEFTARQELKAAEARLKEEAIGRALKVAEEILKKRVTDREELKLFEEYLREVESGS